MSNISRSEYMKVVNENKKLKNDLRAITIENDITTFRKWRNHFKKDDEFMDALKQYAHEHPSDIIVQRKLISPQEGNYHPPNP